MGYHEVYTQKVYLSIKLIWNWVFFSLKLLSFGESSINTIIINMQLTTPHIVIFLNGTQRQSFFENVEISSRHINSQQKGCKRNYSKGKFQRVWEDEIKEFSWQFPSLTRRNVQLPQLHEEAWCSTEFLEVKSPAPRNLHGLLPAKGERLLY